MLNSTISVAELDRKLDKFFSSFRTKLDEAKNPQKASPGSSLAPKELPVGVNFKSMKFKRMIGYLLVLHYLELEKTVQCYMLLDLEDLFGKTEAYWLTVLLDRDLFLKYLVAQETMTEQQFFSGICNNSSMLETISLISLRFEEKLRRPKRIVRRKGYRDKGSLGSVTSAALKKGIAEDYYLTQVQLQLEQKQKKKQEVCILLRDYLSEGRVLTDQLLFEFKLKKGVNPDEESNRNSPEEDYVKRRSFEELNS